MHLKALARLPRVDLQSSRALIDDVMAHAGATGEQSNKVVTSTSYEMDGVARDDAIRRIIYHGNAPESTSDSMYYCTGSSLVCSTHSGRMKWEIDLSDFSGCRGRPILLEAQAKVSVHSRLESLSIVQHCLPDRPFLIEVVCFLH